MDHVGVGKEWSLSRKVGGMFILPGSIYGLKKINGKFLLRDIINNVQYLERSQADYVVVSASSRVCNMDYRPAAEAHAASGADITVIYKNTDCPACGSELAFEIEPSGRVGAAREGLFGSERRSVFADAFIIGRELLINITKWYEATGYMDLTDIIAANLGTWKVYGYGFEGYMGGADNIGAYMKTSRDLLDRGIAQELFNPDRPIKTKIQDAPPAKYFPESEVKNSLISSGCIIRGRIANSIIFRGVTVEAGAEVRDCVIMQNTVVGRDAALENVICDKYAVIREGARLSSAGEPIVVGKGQVV
jgi:glucose-1-phosphate adenylyltransferase